MTRLRLLLAALLVLAAVGSCQPVSATGFVHTSGQQLLDGNDQPLRLNGVGLGTWLLKEHWLMGQTGTTSTVGETNMRARLAGLVGQTDSDTFWTTYEQQFITQADIQQVAADGFNVVRVAFNARYLTSQLPMIDNVIDWAAQAGIYVVLDMHAAPCSQNPYFTSDSVDGTAGLWYGPGAVGCKQQTVTVWQTIAARYANNTTVAAYDLLNEPDGLSMTNVALAGLYHQIITAIRSYDQNHVVMVEGRSFTKDVSPFTAPLDGNLVLSIHQYARSTTMPAQQISQAVTAAGKLGGVPIWVGEFGLDTAANIALQLARFDAQPAIVGWAYWPWKMAARTDTQDGLNEYTAPASWVTLINWLAGKTSTAPTVAQAQTGMADLLTAIGQTTPNTAMLQTLGSN